MKKNGEEREKTREKRKKKEKEREKQENNRHEKGKGDSRHWYREYFSLVFSLFSLYFSFRVQSTCSL